MQEKFLSWISMIFNISLWYGLTIASAIFSKEYLLVTNDPYTLSLVSFLCGASLWPIFGSSIRELFQAKVLIIVGLLHVGGTLLTNVGMTKTTVSFTYMIKASEPICVALLSTLILGKSSTKNVYMSLIVIFFGVTLTVLGEIKLSIIGLIAVIGANLSTASRNVYYSSGSHKESPFQSYMNICVVSLVLFAPLFLIRQLINILIEDHWYFKANTKVFNGLFFGSLFHFLYNMFSFRVLSNISPVSHSIINVMKRIVTIFSSLIYFKIPLTIIQFFGIIISNFGVWLYVRLKNRKEISKSGVIETEESLNNIEKRKKILLIFMVVIIYGVVFDEITKFNFDPNKHANFMDTNFKFNIKMYDERRFKCLRTIKSNMLTEYSFIPKNKKIHLSTFSTEQTFINSLKWVGLYKLINQLQGSVGELCIGGCHNQKYYSKIESDDLLIIDIDGNFEDNMQKEYRTKTISNFPNCTLIYLVETIDASNMNDIDSFHKNRNSYMLFMNLTLYNSILNELKDMKAQPFFKFITDPIFMFDYFKPRFKAKYDIVIIRNHVDTSEKWKKLLEIKQIVFLEIDMENMRNSLPEFKDFNQLNDFKLDDSVISKGKIIVTDEPYVGFLSLLIGKPHIIIGNKRNSINDILENVDRENHECDATNLFQFYFTNTIDAIDTAIVLLENYDSLLK